MKYYIWGNCGTGKTTLSKKISEKLDIPMLDLDAIAFKENWEVIDKQVFIDKVKEFTKNDSYVISGSWINILGDMLLEDADVIIVLQLSYLTNMKAMFTRTLSRVILKVEIHGGNKESFRKSFLTKDSMIYYCHSKYNIRLKQGIEIKNDKRFSDKTIILNGFKGQKKFINNIDNNL